MTKIPDRPRFFYASQRAWAIIKHFNFHTYPIDIYAIYEASTIIAKTYQYYAAKQGLTTEEYIEAAGGAKDGFSIYDNGQYIVAFNTENMTKGRIRWTLAHELGHVVLKHFEEFEATRLSQSGLTEDEYSVLDVEANIFASELLCSPAMVGLLPEQERNVDYISRLFFISRQAAEKAIEQWSKYPRLHGKHATFFEQQFPSYLCGSHESA